MRHVRHPLIIRMALLALPVALLSACGGAEGTSSSNDVPERIRSTVSAVMPGATAESGGEVVLVRTPSASGSASATDGSTSTAVISTDTISAARQRVVDTWGDRAAFEDPVTVVVPDTIEAYARLVGRQSDLPPARTQGLGTKGKGHPWIVVHPEVTTTLSQAELDRVLVHEITHVALDNPIAPGESTLWQEGVAAWTAHPEARAGCLSKEAILDVEDRLHGDASITLRQALTVVTGSGEVPQCLVALARGDHDQ